MKPEKKLERLRREEEFAGEWPTMPRIRLTPEDVFARSNNPPRLDPNFRDGRKKRAAD